MIEKKRADDGRPCEGEDASPSDGDADLHVRREALDGDDLVEDGREEGVEEGNGEGGEVLDHEAEDAGAAHGLLLQQLDTKTDVRDRRQGQGDRWQGQRDRRQGQRDGRQGQRDRQQGQRDRHQGQRDRRQGQTDTDSHTYTHQIHCHIITT